MWSASYFQVFGIALKGFPHTGNGLETTGFRLILWFPKEMRSILSTKVLDVTPLTSNWVCCTKMAVLPSPSSLRSPHDRPINPRRGVEARNSDFIQKANRPRRWQTRFPEKPSYQGVDASFFYRTERGRRWGCKVKRPFILQNISSHGHPMGRECVNFFFSAAIHKWVGSECLSVR